MGKLNSMARARADRTGRFRVTAGRLVQVAVGLVFLGLVAWRANAVIAAQAYSPAAWYKFLQSGLVIGAVYSLVAVGYTLVYGILFMINFAHGEVMMLGAFAGYFVLEAARAIPTGQPGVSFLDLHPWWTVGGAFACGMTASTAAGVLLERIAYRPLRGAPRLVPLISAIGASLFLQNSAQLILGPGKRIYTNPRILDRAAGWQLTISGEAVTVPYTAVLTLLLTLGLMVMLWFLVKTTRFGRAMRAVAENRQTAALMGIDVDEVIGRTFALSGALAGAAGVMWGIHNGIIFHFVGFIPGIKAFTAAVLGGIGNIPGAVLGGLMLGVIESIGPPLLGMDFQLKDVIAFSILVLVLVFRPSGILGEVLSEDKI